MYGTKLCLCTFDGIGLSMEEQLRLFKETGFDGFFTDWCPELRQFRALADELGLIFQSVHAPFGNAAKIWKDDPEGEQAVQELLRCVQDCSDVEVPILVVHPYIGFDEASPTEAGLAHFRTVVQEAKKRNVKIAFENVEGEAFLHVLMDAFVGEDTVGFCWDSGHELCYNRGKDMLQLYGDRLLMTHLNDNLGVSRYDGSIFWTDDLHLLPFDGVADWKRIAERLNRCGYQDVLTFELNRSSKPNRHDNDKYLQLPIEQYIAECYARACRLACLKKGC